MTKVFGLPPVCDENSRVLILGSFPSVKSRETGFYYGNPKNRFWKTLCSYFGDNVPESADGKKAFCLRLGIALWDVVTECEIEGSKDETIKNFRIADLNKVFDIGQISYIIVNGQKAWKIFSKAYPNLLHMSVCLPSTSPANTRFNMDMWTNALDFAF